MPNQVIANSFAIFRCPETNAIQNIEWFAGHICSSASAQTETPKEAVFLKESFGEGSAQVLNFEFQDDEHALYASTNDALREEMHAFLKATGEVTILAAAPKPENATQFVTLRWTIPVAVYENYMEMVDDLAKLSSQAAATYNVV